MRWPLMTRARHELEVTALQADLEAKVGRLQQALVSGTALPSSDHGIASAIAARAEPNGPIAQSLRALADGWLAEGVPESVVIHRLIYGME